MAFTLGIVFGPNGVGKGTLASELSKKYNFLQINMGNILRVWIKENNLTTLQMMLDNGEFIPDDIVETALEDFLVKHQKNRTLGNAIVEGIPRKKSQIKFFQKIVEKYGFKLNWVLILNAPIEDILERVQHRVTTSDGIVYHLKVNPPPPHLTAKDLFIRADDRPDIVKKRYETFMTDTMECLGDPYFLNVKIGNVDGRQEIHKVLNDAVKFIDSIEQCE